jgi:N-acetylmuramoyl-L-alanine amidase
MEFIEAPSPNFDARTSPPNMLVLHYTGMATGEAALERMRDPVAAVSAHYMVEEDGRVFRLVPEERRAWHAGVSFWQGDRNLNGFSIGIEIVNPGHEFGYRPYPKGQIDQVLALLADIRTRWTIPDDRIVGHSDIAPLRKEDPGEKFPWKRLAKAGHGLWIETQAAPGQPLQTGDEGVGVLALQSGLSRLGYEVERNGSYDETLARVVTAFQRHWRPEAVHGVADGETRSRLMGLLRLPR